MRYPLKSETDLDQVDRRRKIDSIQRRILSITLVFPINDISKKSKVFEDTRNKIIPYNAISKEFYAAVMFCESKISLLGKSIAMSFAVNCYYSSLRIDGPIMENAYVNQYLKAASNSFLLYPSTSQFVGGVTQHGFLLHWTKSSNNPNDQSRILFSTPFYIATPIFCPSIYIFCIFC